MRKKLDMFVRGYVAKEKENKTVDETDDKMKPNPLGLISQKLAIKL